VISIGNGIPGGVNGQGVSAPAAVRETWIETKKMKNATKHAETLRSLLRSLLKEGRPVPPEKVDPLKALVRGAMVADVTDSRADEALRIIEREFVNLNELRVATELEVQEMLGARYPDIEGRVQTITHCLHAIFEKEGTLSLDRLKTMSKRDARQYLRDLPGITPFVEAYVVLYGFDGGSAVPVDNEMLEYLKSEDILESQTTIDEAQRFLENNLKSEECYEFFAVVRRALFGERKRKAKA
jgi:endonuclease III